MKTLVGLCGVVIACAAVAQTHQDTITRSGAASEYGGELSVSGNTGNASYGYPFALPAARGRYQPTLGLGYSSGGRGGAYGVGWSLPLSFIERDVRATPLDASGVSREEFWLNLGGARTLLVKVGPPTTGGPAYYRPDVSSRLLSLVHDSALTAWTMTDAKGTTYTFDLSYDSQGARCTSGCMRWYLHQVQDSDGNVCDYEYTNEGDNGQPLQWIIHSPSMLLQSIRYNDYDNHTKYATEIDLTYEPEPNPQLDALDYGLAYHNQRLSRVSIENQGSLGMLPMLTYAMTYAASTETNRSLLTQISVIGVGGATGPQPTTFTYEGRFDGTDQPGAAPAGFKDGQNIVPPVTGADATTACNAAEGTPCPPARYGAWVDIDGDKRPDLVFGNVWYDGVNAKGLYWARNLGYPPSALQIGGMPPRLDAVHPLPGSAAWAGKVSFGTPTGEQRTHSRFFDSITDRMLDMNGDGRPDLVEVSTIDNCLYVSLAIGSGAGAGFGPQQCWDASAPRDAWNFPGVRPSFGTSYSSYGKTWGDLVDFDGDGIPDYVISNSTGWQVFRGYINGTSAGFAARPLIVTQFGWPTSSWPPIRYVDTNGSTTIDFADINGDGVRDRIISSPGQWLVEYGTGRDFVSMSYVQNPDLSSIAYATIPDQLANENALAYDALSTDLNGDGINDYVIKHGGEIKIVWTPASGSNQSSSLIPAIKIPHVYVTPTTTTRFPPPQSGSHEAGMLVDADGDGVLDYIYRLDSPIAYVREWIYYQGTSPRNANRADVLRSVTTPLGATTTLYYSPSTIFDRSSFGSIYPVVTRTEVTGPALKPNGVSYWYAQPVAIPSWDDPQRVEYLGFQESWAQDDVTKVVTHTVWNTTHALAGTTQLVERGTIRLQPGGVLPPIEYYDAFSSSSIDWKTRLTDGSGTCAASPSTYPVIPFPSQTSSTVFESGQRFTRTSSIACGDVDDLGNVKRVSVDADTALPGDEYVVSSTFSTNAFCRDCPVETKVTSAAATPRVFSDTIYDYYPESSSSRGHLQRVKHVVDEATGVYETAAEYQYYTNGNLFSAAQILPAVTSSLFYDGYGLRVTRRLITDGTTSLTTSYLRDPDTGRVTLVRGPTTDPTKPSSTRSYAYDGFGRVLGIGRDPVQGGQVPRAIAAFQYLDAAVPVSMRSFSFADSTTVSVTPLNTDGLDAHGRQTWFDGVGRAIQTRDWLGRAQASEGAHDTGQTLNGYLVSGATLYDGAGRLWASVEPFYSSSGDYHDLSLDSAELTGPGHHAVVRTYDAQSRPLCAIFMPVSGSPPPESAAGACVSDFSDSTAYRLATSTSYGTSAVSAAEGSLPGNFLTVSVTPARENGSPDGRPVFSYFDASGRKHYSRDAYGNLDEAVLDELGRTTQSIRRATGTSLSVTSSVVYDLRGRIAEQDDQDFGTRLFSYYPSGQLRHISQMAGGRELHGVDYKYQSLGRLTEVDDVEWSQDPSGNWSSATTLSGAYTYDQPFAGGSYGYTAGHLASAANGAATIAFGYNEDGAVTGRDEWFAADATNPHAGDLHSAARTFGNDGRLLDTTVSLPEMAAPVSYGTWYDSAGRPQSLVGASTFWSAPDPGAVNGVDRGAYDPLGRIPKSLMDDGNVTNAAAFSQNTDLPASLSTRFTASQAPIYVVTGMQFLGDKLASYTEQAGATSFSMSYDHDGRLSEATASGDGTNAVSQTYDQKLSTFVDKSFDTTAATKGSLWNVEHVYDTSADSDEIYLYDEANHPEEVDQVVANPITGKRLTRTFNYLYDSRGVVTDETSAGQLEAHYDYDAENRLTTVTRPACLNETLTYGPFGELVKREVVSADQTQRMTLYYVGQDGTAMTGQPLTTNCDPGGATKTGVHLLLGGLRIATVRDGSTLYYHRDRLGSVVATSLNGGVAGASYRYDPYGARQVAQNETPDDASELGYTGARTLSGGLVYLNARVYDAYLRRFLQPDNIDPLRYTYIAGDPANDSDPSGHGEATEATFVAWSWWNWSEGTYGFSPLQAAALGQGGGAGSGDIIGWLYVNGAGQKTGAAGPQGIPGHDIPVYGPNMEGPNPGNPGESGSPGTGPAAWGPGADTGNAGPVGHAGPGNARRGTSKGKNVPRWMDYFSINLNIAIPNPYTLTLVGVSGQLALDRYGKIYFGIGPTVGKSATVVSGSVTAGWLFSTTTPSKPSLKGFLTRSGFNGGLGYWGGAGPAYTPGSGWSFEVGALSPQVGLSYHYSWNIAQTPLSW